MTATRCRLVTFLGTGTFDPDLKIHRYKPTFYNWQNKLSRHTEWIIQGIFECYATPPDEIIVLATKTALEKIGERLNIAAQSDDFPFFKVDGFPEGGDDNVVWRQFECLKKNLRAPADTNVILDITHGFRSQPFFAAAVVAFVRALDEYCRETKVIYGAYEAKDETRNITPIWDLTSFVDLLDWTRELMLFLRTGRAKGVEQLIGNAPEFADLAASIGRFGADLETVRTGALLLGDDQTLSSARKLQQALRAAKEKVEQRFPPFADVLERVHRMVDPLVIERQPLNTPDAHRAVASLANLYLSTGRYVEATTTAQEGWVNLYANDAAATPGNEHCTADARKKAAAMWRELEKKYPHKASAIRNDINHAGYRPKPMINSNIIKDAISLVKNFTGATRKPIK